MPETRHELAVGESVVIDDYLLTVEDIRGEEVLFRMERISTGPSAGDGSLGAETVWEPDAASNSGDGLVGDGLMEVQPNEIESSPGRSAARSRPR